jgi:uncharacterized protein YjbJ (UPF0337 family)
MCLGAFDYRMSNGEANSPDDLERAGGKADPLIGLLQQKYGYTRGRADQEFNRRIEEPKENR